MLYREGVILKVEEIDFNAEEHTYTWRGRRLSGVTGAIAAELGKKYGTGSRFISEACRRGSEVHGIVSLALTERRYPKDKDARYVVDALEDKYGRGFPAETEWLVSDLRGAASCIDIAVRQGNGSYDLLDIKTGAYDLAYCSMQLSLYRCMLKISRGFSSENAYVVSTKHKDVFYVPFMDDEWCVSFLTKHFKDVSEL
jgi:hypothetical protein